MALVFLVDVFKLILFLTYIFTLIINVSGLTESLYCGTDNCYDVLGITRDADKTTVKQAYKRLALKHHPDKQKTVEDKKSSESIFTKLVTAYEILRDEEQRKEYDYMLDNPEQMYYHYYQYYRRRYAPTVDWRIVIAVFITTISVFQYYGQWSNYHEAINYFTKDSRYRSQAKEIAKSENLLPSETGSGARNGMKRSGDRKRLTKEELKAWEERVIRKIITEKMDIRGGYQKPSLLNILWLQLITWPYYLTLYICWSVRWIFLFWIMKQDYGREEQEYVIRKKMKLSQLQWTALEDREKEKFIQQKLWIKENYAAYAEIKAAEMKAKQAEDTKYRQYRRYLKRGGAGQIVFGQEDVDVG